MSILFLDDPLNKQNWHKGKDVDSFIQKTKIRIEVISDLWSVLGENADVGVSAFGVSFVKKRRAQMLSSLDHLNDNKTIRKHIL